ncbi:MAG: hypothetical protein J5802_09500 [Butyrivibrio sp.]|nr:hypothetical protein [Butyrivibrio sp.]
MRSGYRKTYTTILLIALIISIIINLIFTIFFIQNKNESTSYKGTWKYSGAKNALDIEITMYVDGKATFYMAFSAKDEIYQACKGYIEEDTLIYKGKYTIQEGDHFDYLSDIPDEEYEEINSFYSIDRVSKNSIIIKNKNEEYDFIRVDMN